MSKIKGEEYDSIILDEIGTIDLSQFTANNYPTVGNISYDSSNMSTNAYSSTQWITVTTPTTNNSYITSDTITFDDVEWRDVKEFEDTMPDLSKINEMCEIYPGLKKAFDYFKDIYDLVHDDYLERKNSDD